MRKRGGWREWTVSDSYSTLAGYTRSRRFVVSFTPLSARAGRREDRRGATGGRWRRGRGAELLYALEGRSEGKGGGKGRGDGEGIGGTRETR